MRESQADRMMEAMASGKWVCNERFIEMRIPDYRRRMCDLKARFPGRYAKRSRTHTRPDGDRYVMDDWRDTEATAGFAAIVRRQLIKQPVGPVVAVSYHGETLYLSAAQTEAMTLEEQVAYLFERYIDPWLGEGVRREIDQQRVDPGGLV